MRVKLYFDYKSPFSYLAKDPAYEIEKDYQGKVVIDWLPFAFYVDEAFGQLDSRSKWQWKKVRYGYRDARRFANARDPPLVVLGPQKVFNSSLSLMGGLYAMKKGMPVFYKYTDIVFEGFFTRKLDIENHERIVEVLNKALSSSLSVSARDTEEWLKGFAAFVKEGEGEGWKELRRIREQGEKDEIFGVPSFIVAGEPFFGNDRVDWLRRHIDSLLQQETQQKKAAL